MKTNSSSQRLAVAGFLAVVGLVSAAQAQEAEVKLDQVPKPVMEAAKVKFPGAKIKEASKETENGKTVFELEMTHEDRNMDVTFQSDGTLVLVETQVSEKGVPAAVLKAVKDKYPGAKISLIESVKKGPEVKKEADYYEFHLTTADKKSAEVEVDPKGKILKTEEKKGNEKDAD
jgi:uncharacterized membrane protein YkoI